MKPVIRQIISVHPHAVLRKQATEVTDFGELLTNKIERMRKVMTTLGGQGIAANQCFMSDNIFIGVIDGAERVFINPRIVDVEQNLVRSTEGCLSVPGIVDTVDRFSGVTLEYQIEDGTRVTSLFIDQAAVVVQHEMDHLNGKLFCDTLSDLKQSIIKRKMKKFKKAKGLI